jgi:hypothetical protein
MFFCKKSTCGQPHPKSENGKEEQEVLFEVGFWSGFRCLSSGKKEKVGFKTLFGSAMFKENRTKCVARLCPIFAVASHHGLIRLWH